MSQKQLGGFDDCNAKKDKRWYSITESGTLILCFGRQKQCFPHLTEKIIITVAIIIMMAMMVSLMIMMTKITNKYTNIFTSE